MGLSAYLAIARRRAIVLILCILAGAAGAIGIVKSTPKQYEATATYFVNLPQGSNTDNGSQGFTIAAGLLSSFQQLITTQKTAAGVAARLGLQPSDVIGHLSAKAEGQTFFTAVTAHDRDPARARQLADAAVDVVVGEIPEIQTGLQSPVTAAFIDRASTPTHPYTPKPTRSVILGVLFGLVAGLALTALLEALDRSVRGADEAQRLAGGAPLLTLIPRRRGSAAARLVVSDADTEPYRSLRTSIQFLRPDAEPRLLLITSATPGDGKTTTAANLAVAIAESGRSVVLVDTDLRRSQLTRALGLSKQPGLSSLATRQAELQECLFAQGAVTVLPAGPTPPNPSEIVGSQATANIFATLREHYDVVIADGTPVLPVTDAVALAPQADAVLLVVRHGETQRAAIAAAVQRLASVGCDPAGIVLNAAARSESEGYYGQYVYAAPGPVRSLSRRGRQVQRSSR